MHISKITIKNLMSYGEVPVEFIFDRHNMTMINGINGLGKSSVIEAIFFLFYNKAFRDVKKKEHLINSANGKNLVVEGHLIGNNGKQVIVRRGMKPNIFEIFEDGILVNQNAKSLDYQMYLETYILGMNASTFAQTVIISKTKYTPFMRLRAGDRRQFVESILGIEIFGEMQKIQNKIVSALKEEEKVLRTKIIIDKNNFSNTIDSIKRYKQLIEVAKNESYSEIKREIAARQTKIDTCENLIETYKSNIGNIDYTQKIELSEKVSTRLTTEKHKLTTLSRERIAIEKNDTGKCGACGSVIDTSHVKLHIEEIDSKIEIASSNIVKLEAKLIELRDYVIANEKQILENSRINSEIKSRQRLIDSHNDEIENLKSKTIDTSHYDKELERLKVSGRTIKSDIEQSNTDLETLLVSIDDNIFAGTLLKDSGIKAAIIQNNIRNINEEINKYLHKFGFFINFELDSEFNETIYFKGTSHLEYNSYSEGEKLRMDLAMIMAWRNVALKKSGMSCNLLFFDEIVDASMDLEGVELFAKALQALPNTNTWIITHTPEKIENYIRGYITLEKVDGFTIIKQNK